MLKYTFRQRYNLSTHNTLNKVAIFSGILTFDHALLAWLIKQSDELDEMQAWIFIPELSSDLFERITFYWGGGVSMQQKQALVARHQWNWPCISEGKQSRLNSIVYYLSLYSFDVLFSPVLSLLHLVLFWSCFVLLHITYRYFRLWFDSVLLV